MKRTRHPGIRGVPLYAVLILSGSVLIALPGCKREPSVGQQGQTGPMPHGPGVAAKLSPIMVADGSMLVRTYTPNSALAGSTLTISGGQACATGPGAQSLSDDLVDGPGVSFTVQFSPAILTIKNGGGAHQPRLRLEVLQDQDRL